MSVDDPAGPTRGAGRARRLLPRGGTRYDGPARPEPAEDGGDQRGIDAVIGDSGVYEDGHRLPGRLPLDRAGEAARSTSGFVWIGLQQPSTENIAAVADEFDLPPLAVEDAVKAHQRPKLEVYDDVVFMVLKPVRYVDHEEVVEVSEIALFLGPKFVITVRHGRGDVLRRVRAELDRGNSELLASGPTAVLYRTADLVVDGYEEAIVSITEDVDEIESQVFGDDELDHAERIYKLKREIAEFRRAVLPLATPLHRLAEGLVPVVDKVTAPYFRDVHDHALRAADAIEGHDRLLSDVLQADLARVEVRQSRIALRQNEDMRKISAWAAIALVPTAVAGIYGMNFEYMPELTWRFGYFMVLGLIAAVCLVLHRLFRRSGWL
ncbi:MAG: magnesium and cobalt transport protein CorA [Propionibacteriaceae bacterium]|jgi:magnesium transporter|nr:magnesium and cobalt transport protein CorA [Propionibacteriaceae bacterium]